MINGGTMMHHTRKRPLLRLATLLLTLTMLLSSVQALTPQEAGEILQEFYVDQVPQEVLEQPTVQEMLQALGDPYTAYFTPEEYQEYLNSMLDEQIVGIGITAYGHELGLLIAGTYEGSPAEAAGIVAGDIIVAVDGVKTAGQTADAISSWLRGEAGSPVSVTLLAPDGSQRTLTMKRQLVVIPATTTELVDGRIGYIVCDTFGSETLGHFQEGVQEYKQQAKNWIVDLRTNLGGDVLAATRSLGCFLGQGDMIYLRDGSGAYSRFVSDVGEETMYPVVVLTSQWTASASEMFAGAIRDYRDGLIVGGRTYGKGVAQVVLDQDTFPGPYFADGSGMKVTAYRYFSVNGNTADQIGVIPHLLVSDEYAADVAYLLCGVGSDEKSDGLIRLHMGGWRWYVNLEEATDPALRKAFAQLLEAVSPETDLYWGEGGDRWSQVTPEEVARRCELSEYTTRSFQDVSSSPYAHEINTLGTYQIVKGGGDGNFHPAGVLNRAELCALLAQAMNYDLQEGEVSFSDVPADAWYAPYVQALHQMGLVEGDGTGAFHPLEPVSHEAFITIMGRLTAGLNMQFYETAKIGPQEEDLNRADLAGYSDWAREWVWLLGASQENYFGMELNLLFDDLDAIDAQGATLREEAACLMYSILTVTGILDL
jgi:carboxyl-terminal processing protease